MTPARFSYRFMAAFVAYALAIPYVAAIIAVIGYVAPANLPARMQWLDSLWPNNAFLAGMLWALIVWILFSLASALLNNRLAAADGPNSGTYGEIRSNLDLLSASLDTLSSFNMTFRERSAYNRACRLRNSIRTALNSDGLQWLWGRGYIDLWRNLHRAQEELIQAQSKAEVIGGAKVDYLRLRGSTIANSNDLLRDLRVAAISLKPETAQFFVDLPVTSEGNITAGAAQSIKHKYAREVLKRIRYTINEYRDEQRNGVLYVRNRILFTIIITEVVALLTLGLAITCGADVTSVIAASAFFLIGTGLGLLYNRLYTSLETNSAVSEDYGLALTRLWATPLFSGLAAVAGVLLIAVLPSVVDISPTASSEQNALVTTPAVTTAEQGSSESAPQNNPVPAPDQPPPSLREIFELDTPKLIIAAVFGLSPGYLFDRLGNANQLLSNLRSTGPGNQSGTRVVG